MPANQKNKKICSGRFFPRWAKTTRVSGMFILSTCFGMFDFLACLTMFCLFCIGMCYGCIYFQVRLVVRRLSSCSKTCWKKKCPACCMADDRVIFCSGRFCLGPKRRKRDFLPVITATPATANEDACDQAPRRPPDRNKVAPPCHACHAKRR